MSAFFELRTYKVFPGKMDEWLKYMEDVIIPFQVGKGMVIHGSFTVKSDNDTYIWIRRFESNDHKDDLYEKIYKSEEWLNKISPNVQKLIDVKKIKVDELCSTALSIMK